MPDPCFTRSDACSMRAVALHGHCAARIRGAGGAWLVNGHRGWRRDRVSGAGVMLATGQVERHRNAGGDDVGAVAKRGREDQVKMIMQEGVAQSIGYRHWDQHHNLLGALLAEPVEERQDRPGYGGVLGVQDDQRWSWIPAVPLLL